MKRFLLALGVLAVISGAVVLGRAAGGSESLAAANTSVASPTVARASAAIPPETAAAGGWFKVPYFPDPHPLHCSADLLASVCCLEAYVQVADVNNACALSTTRLVRVVRSPFGVSSCCDCDHEFCVQITSTTPVVSNPPAGACTLVVLECYNNCSDCLHDL